MEHIRKKHGLTDESLASLSREVRIMLVQEADEDIHTEVVEKYGSYYAYQNHCAQKKGYKNRMERDKERLQERGFATKNEYRKYLATRKTKATGDP